MKPLLVLNSVFIAVLIFSRFFGNWNYVLAGNIAMSVMLVFTAIGHFIFPRGMAMMLPDFFPFKKLIVYASGLFEVLAAVGILIPASRTVTSLFLIVFFLMVLPVNINAAIRKVDFEKADNSGRGLDYLWIRIPMQVVFILWVWYFGLNAG